MQAGEIRVGKTYEAKRRREVMGVSNDRYILWVSPDLSQVQYDSDTVRDGAKFPTISMEKFLRWVKREVVKGGGRNA